MILRKRRMGWNLLLLHLSLLLHMGVALYSVSSAAEEEDAGMMYNEEPRRTAPAVVDRSASSASASALQSRSSSGPSQSTAAAAAGSKSLMEKAHDLFIAMMYKSEIPGLPGKDYPIMADIPTTTRFRCRDHYNVGYYADVDYGCQVIHVCQADGSHESFLCPNGTIFNQQYFVCDWWFNVDCDQSPSYYKLNGGIGKVAEVKSDDVDDTAAAVDADLHEDDEQQQQQQTRQQVMVKADTADTEDMAIVVEQQQQQDDEVQSSVSPIVGVSEKDYFQIPSAGIFSNQESRIVEVIKH